MSPYSLRLAISTKPLVRTDLQKNRYMTRHVSQPWSNVLFGLHFWIAQVEYQGQTRYTILDSKHFLDTFHEIRHRLEFKFLSSHNFCSMLIEQLINLRKVTTENLRFRTDLRERVMDGWPLTRNMIVFSSRLLKKKLNRKLKLVQSIPVFIWLWSLKPALRWNRSSSSQYMSLYGFETCFAMVWLKTGVLIDFRILLEIVFKRLRSAIWNRCANWLEFEQTLFSRKWIWAHALF